MKIEKVGFFTTSGVFDSLINGFKKRGVNALRIDNYDQFSACSVIIIDLAYPFERAYTVLQTIKSDYQLSESIIFVAISDKSQIKKLRSFSFGVHGYITPNIEFELLFKKVREAFDPKQYLIKKDFKNIPVSITTQGQLTHMTETGALIHSKVSFDLETPLQLNGSMFDHLELSSGVKCKISKKNPLSRKKFITEILFTAFSDEHRDKIRKIIFSWNVK